MKTRSSTFTFKCDPSFSPERLREYDLIFQVTQHSCSFSLFDPGEQRYIGLAEAEVPIEQLRGEIPWIGKSARSVGMIIANKRFTLVPEELFEEPVKEAYLKLSIEDNDEENVLHDRIDALGLITVYSIEQTLLEHFTDIYPEAEVRHISGVFIGNIWMNFKNRLEEKRIFLEIRNDEFLMLIFGNRKLLFCNAFHATAAEDLVYYLLFVMEQHDLNPEEIPVTLTGKADHNTRLCELLKKYVRHVDFASRNGSVKFSPVFDDLPGHHFYTLLNP